MDRILETHHFGPHRVDVVEFLDDEARGPVVIVVDGLAITEPLLDGPPTEDEVVRIYARWRAAKPG